MEYTELSITYKEFSQSAQSFNAKNRKVLVNIMEQSVQLILE